MPNATFVKRNELGQLREYIYQIPNITQTVTQEMVFPLDRSFGNFEGIKLAALNVGNTVTISSFIYEKSGVSTPTVYGIYESTVGSAGVGIAVSGLGRPFINNDSPEASQIYGIFRNTANTPTLTMTVALYIK